MGTVGLRLIGRFEVPVGADEMLGTSRRGAAFGLSVGEAVSETSMGLPLGAAEGSLVGVVLGFPYGRAVEPECGDWIGDRAGLANGGMPVGPCTTIVGSSVNTVDGIEAGALFGNAAGALDPDGTTRGARGCIGIVGCNGCAGALVMDGATGPPNVGLSGLAGELPLAVGRLKACGARSLDPGGRARGARGGNGCIGALVRDETTGDAGLVGLTGELPMGRRGLAVGRPTSCGTGALPMGDNELRSISGTGADATVGLLAIGDSVGAKLAGLLGAAVGEMLLGKLCAGASGTMSPLVPSLAGAAVRVIVGTPGSSTTGLCAVGAAGLCPIGAMGPCATGLLVILTTGGATGFVALALFAVATGLAMGNDAVVGAVAVMLSGAVRGTGAEAVDGTVPRGDNADGAIGVRSSLRASVDKVGVDAGAMGTAAGATAGLDPIALGAVGGTRLVLVWNEAMGFSVGDAVGWNNVSK
jgi:hypothetical protein